MTADPETIDAPWGDELDVPFRKISFSWGVIDFFHAHGRPHDSMIWTIESFLRDIWQPSAWRRRMRIAEVSSGIPVPGSIRDDPPTYQMVLLLDKRRSLIRVMTSTEHKVPEQHTIDALIADAQTLYLHPQ